MCVYYFFRTMFIFKDIISQVFDLSNLFGGNIEYVENYVEQ